jgi:hypothetical protein
MADRRLRTALKRSDYRPANLPPHSSKSMIVNHKSSILHSHGRMLIGDLRFSTLRGRRGEPHTAEKQSYAEAFTEDTKLQLLDNATARLLQLPNAKALRHKVDKQLSSWRLRAFALISCCCRPHIQRDTEECTPPLAKLIVTVNGPLPRTGQRTVTLPIPGILFGRAGRCSSLARLGKMVQRNAATATGRTSLL